MRLALGIVLLMLCVGNARGQATDTAAAPTTARTPVSSAIIGGIVGSGIGMVSGAAIGQLQVDCSYPDSGAYFCGLGETIIGIAIGATVGSAAGAYLGARLGGGRPSEIRTLLAAIAGFGGGLLVGRLADSSFEPDVSGFVGFTIGQGVITGLGAARWR